MKNQITANNNNTTVPARDIELKVQSVNRGGVILCPYVSKRFVVNELNRRYSEYGWRLIRNEARDMACIEIKSPDGEWVAKGYDVGTASEFEAAKGLLTDAFKRAAALVGIAGALATGPQIFIYRTEANIVDDGKGKGKCYDRFRVLEIEYDEQECISYIKILNENTGRICFEWRDIYSTQSQKTTNAPEAPERASNEAGGTNIPANAENATQSPTEPQTAEIKEPEQQVETLNTVTMTPPPEAAGGEEIQRPTRRTVEQYRTYTSHKDELQDLLSKNKIKKEWFCEKMNLDRLKDISENKARKCCEEINKIKENWERDKHFYVTENEIPFI